jgi:dTDP-4-dehydrorhamnose 3,5-epimerase
MRIEPTKIKGLWAVRLEWHGDMRGTFARLFCRDEFAARGLADVFVQASLSVSYKADTLRGMHFQRAPYTEVKLVSCLRGAIYDVVVDLRPDSPTFRRWQGFDLTQAGELALYIPKGCAHGFQTMTNDCEVLYQMDTPYAPAFANGVRYDNPALGIVWPRPVSVISEKDLGWPPLSARGIG